MPARGVAFRSLPARPFVGRGAVDRCARAGDARSLGAARRGALVRRLGARRGGRHRRLRLGARRVLGGARCARRPVAPRRAQRARRRAPTAGCRASPPRRRSRVPSGGGGLRCPTAVNRRAGARRVLRGASSTPRGRRPRRGSLVLGGSQGARSSTDCCCRPRSCLRDRGPALVGGPPGRRSACSTKRVAAYAAAGSRARSCRSSTTCRRAMAAADLVVSRAGAITLAEICAARAARGAPAAAPLAAGHQIENARGARRGRSGARSSLTVAARSPATIAARARRSAARARPDAARWRMAAAARPAGARPTARGAPRSPARRREARAR